MEPVLKGKRIKAAPSSNNLSIRRMPLKDQATSPSEKDQMILLPTLNMDEAL